MPPNAGLVFEQSRLGLIARYIELYQACFPHARYTERYLMWLYGDNPAGTIVGIDAFHNGELVGQVAAIPAMYRYAGALAKGLVAVNVCVHPKFEGQLLFRKLGLRLCELARSLHQDFIMGVANAAATGGWTRLMGFHLLSALSAEIGFGSLCVDSADMLEADFAHAWTPQSYLWRCANPENKLRSAILPSGLIATWGASTCRYIYAYAELPAAGEEMYSNALPLSLFPRVFVGLLPEHHKRLYVPVPKRMRPSPLNWVYMNLHDRNDKPDVSRCLVSFLDFDAF